MDGDKKKKIMSYQQLKKLMQEMEFMTFHKDNRQLPHYIFTNEISQNKQLKEMYQPFYNFATEQGSFKNFFYYNSASSKEFPKDLGRVQVYDPELKIKRKLTHLKTLEHNLKRVKTEGNIVLSLGRCGQIYNKLPDNTFFVPEIASFAEKTDANFRDFSAIVTEARKKVPLKSRVQACLDSSKPGTFRIRRSLHGEKLLLSKKQADHTLNNTPHIHHINNTLNTHNTLQSNQSNHTNHLHNGKPKLQILNAPNHAPKPNTTHIKIEDDSQLTEEHSKQSHKLLLKQDHSKIRSQVMVLDLLQREFDRDITYDKRSFTEKFVHSLQKRKLRGDLISLVPLISWDPSSFFEMGHKFNPQSLVVFNLTEEGTVEGYKLLSQTSDFDLPISHQQSLFLLFQAHKAFSLFENNWSFVYNLVAKNPFWEHYLTDFSSIITTVLYCKFLMGETYFESSKRPSCDALTKQLFNILENATLVPHVFRALRVPIERHYGFCFEPRPVLKFFKQSLSACQTFAKPTPKKSSYLSSRKDSDMFLRQRKSEEEHYASFCESVRAAGRVDFQSFCGRSRKQLFLNKVKKFFKIRDRKFIRIKNSEGSFKSKSFLPFF